MDPTAGSGPRARPPGPELLHTPYHLTYLESPPRPAGGQPDNSSTAAASAAPATAAAARSRPSGASWTEAPAQVRDAQPPYSNISRSRQSSSDDDMRNTSKRRRLDAEMKKTYRRPTVLSDSSTSSIPSRPFPSERAAQQQTAQDSVKGESLSIAPPPNQKRVFKMKRTGGRPGGFTRPSNPVVPPSGASVSNLKDPPPLRPLPRQSEVPPPVPSLVSSPRPRISEPDNASQDSTGSESSDAENDFQSHDSSPSSDEDEDDGQSLTGAGQTSSIMMDDDPDVSVSGASVVPKTPRSRARAKAAKKVAGKRGSYRKSRRPYRYKVLAPTGSGLTASASGRSYQVWDDGTAQPIISKGVLFPDGYQKGVVSSLPWICPIRSCRELYLTAGSLSKHWMNIHRCCELNDNADGTFSIKSKYNAKPGAWKKLTPAIVISQKPLDPSEPPMPAPHRPAAKPRDSTEVQTDRVDKDDTKTETRETPRGTPQEDAARFTEIVMATPQREYGKWRGTNGVLVDTKGIPIPEHYRLLNRDEPWVCPIRSCRLLFAEMAHLRQHFTGEHWGCLLNDNRDGTFSITKSSAAGPARVVSKNSLDANAPPAAEPEVDNIPRNKTRESSAVKGPGATPSSAANGDTMAKAGSMRMPYHFAASEATPGSLQNAPPRTPSGMPVPETPASGAASSAAQRSATWSGRNEGTVQDPMTKCRACAQTGNHCLNGDKTVGLPCDSCRKRGGRCNWDLEGAKVKFSKKAAALFPNSAAAAENTIPISRQSSRSRMFGQAAESSLDGVEDSGDEAEDDDMDVDDEEDEEEEEEEEEPYRARKRSRHTSFQDESRESSAETHATQHIVTLRVRPSRLRQVLYGKGMAPEPPRAPRVPGPSREAPPPISRPGPLVQSSAMPATHMRLASANDLEMEDWEVAPGRIRTETSDMPENIAYSNPYLTSNQNIAVDDSLSFRVEIIHPGQSRRFEADRDVLKVCSLGTGKLRVRIEGEPEFAIGPSGMFKIKPGVSCAVENRIYVDSVLHISSVHKSI